MNWNYRVLKTTDSTGAEIWAVHEVYYDAEGEPRSWTCDAVHPSGETWDELHRDAAHYAKAFTQLPFDATGDVLRELTITGRDKQAVASGLARRQRATPDAAPRAGTQKTRSSAASAEERE